MLSGSWASGYIRFGWLGLTKPLCLALDARASKLGTGALGPVAAALAVVAQGGSEILDCVTVSHETGLKLCSRSPEGSASENQLQNSSPYF